MHRALAVALEVPQMHPLRCVLDVWEVQRGAAEEEGTVSP